jgi:CDP-glucose 4,6-dehydratase
VHNFKNKKILITGHTGFKGSWLSFWLIMLGAKVYGVSDQKNISLLYKKKIINFEREFFFDIKNRKKIKKIINTVQPNYIFHLAAQSLLIESYKNPIKTWQTNLIGSLNILDSIKEFKKKITLILVTSDKCYKNVETNRGYKENDILAGEDPYSASKSAVEILFNSYYHSFFKKNKFVKCASVRAGNVIGGGDWSKNRIVPDLIKSWKDSKCANIKSPNSTRPWQYVLEPLHGYIKLSLLIQKNSNLNGQSFNFGPSKSSNFTVLDLVKRASNFWPKSKWQISKNNNFHENKLLRLNSSKSLTLLNWRAKLNFDETIFYTISWYKEFFNNSKNLKDFTKNQILNFNCK